MTEQLQRKIYDEVKLVFKQHGIRFSDVVKKDYNKLSINEARALIALGYHSKLTSPPMLINYLGFPQGTWNRSRRTLEKYNAA